MSGCTAPESLRSESYLQYVAATKDEGNPDMSGQMGFFQQPKEA